ncbi:hypothetical protein C8A00DRAFT_46879 [Chaetomidium leptoderma]|uniref:C2H2-type domain-containing protein n=1 Tax=Chaetomidium leptoderma TaxID=669021 RepID=A0AAN6ZTI4_9PEZI|nr:hypothetical protein C8A00DRAFT_46879 [Chaetomidium leptoderma]
MSEPSLHHNAMRSQSSKPTIPQRGGPSRSSTARKTVVEISDSTESDNEPIVRSNSRPWNMWQARYTQDTTIPDRPWICPVRSCRRLFKAPVDFGNHFRGHHRGARLNDNVDGTFSVKGTNNTGPAVVVSWGREDDEPITSPKRPIYPRGVATKAVVWVSAIDNDALSAAAPIEDDVLSAAVSSEADSESDIMDVVPDNGLEFATEGRPYREWWNSAGKLVSMMGALIPEGYELDDTFPGRPWICPIRSCRCMTHKSCDLNDNGDGTFSVVGLHNRTAPRVVSEEPLDPNEPPMLAPRLPPTSLDARMSGLQKGPVAVPRATSPGAASTRSATASSASNLVWDHISSMVDLPTAARETPEVMALLRLPKVRDLNILPSTLPADLTRKQIAGLMIQVIGKQNPTPCSECRRHKGPFDCCATASPEVADQIYEWLGTCSHACANCIARKTPSQCSLRKMGSARLKLLTRGLEGSVKSNAIEVLSDDPELGEDLTEPRRSTRLSLANGADDDDGEAEDEGEESVNGAPPPEPKPRPSRLVTQKVPGPAAKNDRRLRERRANAVKAASPTEADLHMEDWEMGDGRVNTGGQPLAFSSTYLAANQTVQVSANISFQAATVPSGRVHQFPADHSRTRMCTLTNGKLRVQVGGDEFVIGAQGMFKIAPGMACTKVCHVKN